MEQEHRRITEPVVALINLQPSDRVLDVGCGNGWLCRLVAAQVPKGTVVGIDISDQMVRRAQTASAGLDRVTFLAGSVDRIPWEKNFFTHAISVESAYYWPDPAKAWGRFIACSRRRARHGF
jgi:ubiquinone/menaquinone biosynthesis C-methylase UbiE